MLSILGLLFIKHWWVDFVHQTSDHVKYKGVYGHPKGIEHSVWHGVLTALIFLIVCPLDIALWIGLADFLLHYHIDYVKMRYGEQDISKKEFWKHLGLDQLAHQITYILLIAIATAITIGI
jgi:hypothetical protein